MNKRLAFALLVAFAATSAHAQSRGHGGGGRGGHGGGGHAVQRGHASGGGYRGGGAVARQPRPGGYYGHGYGQGHGRYGGYYGHGRGYYGHGHGYYGHGHRHYGYYPYYGYSPYYAYAGWPYGYGFGLGIGFYYGNGYGYASYSAPYAQVAYGGSYGRPAPAEAEEPADRGQSRIESTTDVGELRLQVGPEDAVVYVDGEFRGIASELVAVRLAPGRHRVEVVRPGYATAEREVHVGRGASASLRIELTPEVERR